MNKLLLFILLISSTIYAQDKDNYLSTSFGFDIRNAAVGSKPTNNESALDWTGEIHAVGDNIDFNLGYEEFKRIEYSRVFVGLGYHIKLFYLGNMKISTQPSIEFSNITRTYNDSIIWQGKEVVTKVSSSFTTPSLNNNLNLDITKHIAIQFSTNILPRPDIRYIYNERHERIVLSNSLKFIYKFNVH